MKGLYNKETSLSLLYVNHMRTHLPFTSGVYQQFTLSYPPKDTYSCPGSNITYTCVLCAKVTAYSVTTDWKGSAFNCSAVTNQAANQISLLQKSGGVDVSTASGSCGNLFAVKTNVSTDGDCYTSVLTIPAVQGLNGTTVMCVDGVTGAVVGNDTVIVKVAGGFVLCCFISVHLQMYKNFMRLVV